ncbi:MAG: hypothetical protein AAGF73_12670 [Actinomycetota bacterium]
MMAARSELSHRLLEVKTSVMGKLVPRVLSRKSTGVDGLAKKLVAKSPPAAPDPTLADELAHPDDVPEIVTGYNTGRTEVEPSGSAGSQR